MQNILKTVGNDDKDKSDRTFKKEFEDETSSRVGDREREGVCEPTRETTELKRESMVVLTRQISQHSSGTELS